VWEEGGGETSNNKWVEKVEKEVQNTQIDIALRKYAWISESKEEAG